MAVPAAMLLAGAAGAAAVAGAWEALAAVEPASVARAGSRAAARLLGPLRAAGRSGRVPTSAERRRLHVVSAATLLAGGWLLAGPWAAIGLAAGAPWLAGRVVAARRRAWRAELARSAPIVARTLSDALAGGHGVRGALGAAAAGGGVGGAAGRELAGAVRALELGESTEAVLDRLRMRAADPGWTTLVAAILLQRDAGGDLAGLLRSIAITLEERARLEADARGATAQARFTAWLVVLLPIAAAILAELAQPGFAAGLAAEPLSATLGGLALGLELAAVLAIRRIAR
jgi:tight adherence protein B